jgi:hypothetical protein
VDSVLIPYFSGNGFSFSPFSIMLAIGLSYVAFIILRYISSIPTFFSAFFHERMLNFVKGVFCKGVVLSMVVLSFCDLGHTV